MLVTTLAIQPKYQKSEQGIAKFYKELDILKEPANPAEKISRRNFGIYDYSKKNKLANNTELEQNNGRAQRNLE